MNEHKPWKTAKVDEKYPLNRQQAETIFRRKSLFNKPPTIALDNETWNITISGDATLTSKLFRHDVQRKELKS